VSAQNVELHRRAYAAFNARDIEAFIKLCDPQMEFHSRFAAVSGLTVYRGHDELRRWHRDLEDTWEGEIRVEVEAYFDLGEQTLAYAVAHARGRQSGAETEMQLAWVARWRDGLMVSLKSHPNREAALSALGVSKDDLEPIAP
jgi:ketosteroid isomerase-like protein